MSLWTFSMEKERDCDTKENDGTKENGRLRRILTEGSPRAPVALLLPLYDEAEKKLRMTIDIL